MGTGVAAGSLYLFPYWTAEVVLTALVSSTRAQVQVAAD